MTIRKSDALTFLEMGDVGLRRALANCWIDFFEGTQPATANAASTGYQKIITFKTGTSSNAYVGETRPKWKVTLSGTTSGSLDTVKIAGFDVLGGAVSYATSFTATAAAAAAQINSKVTNIDFIATSDGADLYIYGPIGVGTGMNALVCATTATTLTATVAGAGTPAASGGTDGIASAYGCNWLAPYDGTLLTVPDSTVLVLSKDTTTWQGSGGFDKGNSAISGFTSGTKTAGWGRICASPSDDGSATSGETGFVRLDFSIGASGADVNISPSPAYTYNVTQYITGFRLKLPKYTT